MSKTATRSAKSKPRTRTGAATAAATNGTARQHAQRQDRPLIHVNGKLLPKSQAVVSVYDHGLLYGDGVFEGIRVYRGNIFKCGQHMDRLWKSAEGIRLNIPVSRDRMVEIMRECVEANKISDGYIRLLVTRGYGTLGLDPRKCPMPGVICISDEIHLYPPELYETGMKVIIAKRPKTPIPCLDPRVKSLNYLNNILAKVEAIEAGCHEAIMLNHDTHEVTECTGDNIFIVKGGKMFTPPTDAGLLEGVTRRFVMDTLAPALKLPCVARTVQLDDVFGADEVFLTGSAAEVIAVNQVDERTIGTGKEGPITKKLRAKFREIVTSDNVPED